MNAVYIRMALYFLAPLAGMIPGVTYDSVSQVVTLDIDAVAMGLAGSALFTGAIFSIWGKK